MSTEDYEAFLATLAPERAAWVRSQVERARPFTPDEARRVAIALGLRPTVLPARDAR